jgi:hypothetical protein
VKDSDEKKKYQRRALFAEKDLSENESGSLSRDRKRKKTPK